MATVIETAATGHQPGSPSGWAERRHRRNRPAGRGCDRWKKSRAPRPVHRREMPPKPASARRFSVNPCRPDAPPVLKCDVLPSGETPRILRCDIFKSEETPRDLKCDILPSGEAPRDLKCHVLNPEETPRD